MVRVIGLADFFPAVFIDHLAGRIPIDNLEFFAAFASERAKEIDEIGDCFEDRLERRWISRDTTLAEGAIRIFPGDRSRFLGVTQ